MKGIELPDYLPSRYQHWLHFYMDMSKVFKEKGVPFNDETTVQLYEFFDPEELKGLQEEERILFYHNFSVAVIKSRALDYVLSKLPTFEEFYAIRNYTLSSPYVNAGSKEIYDALNNLLDICPKNIFI